MKIVIDIDNTVVDYRKSLFNYLAKSNIFLKEINPKNKMNFIKSIIKKKYGDAFWQSIQAYIYSDLSNDVKFYNNCSSFIKEAFLANFDIYLLSHKTKFGLKQAKNINIREIAFKRISNWINEEKIQECIKEIIFTDTFEEKISFIKKIDPLIIIDDLLAIHAEIIKSKKNSSKYINVLFEGNDYIVSIKKTEKIFRANNWIEISEFLLN